MFLIIENAFADILLIFKESPPQRGVKEG